MAAFLAACTSDVVAPPVIVVATVEVTPVTDSIAVTATLQLSATPRDTHGAPLAGRSVAWSSSDTAVATVDATGLVSGKRPGSASVTASVEGKNGTAAIKVLAGPATQLTFASQPGTATAVTAGSPIAPPVQVQARDAQGFTATNFTGDVTIALEANPSGGTLSGTRTAPVISGVATFGDLKIDKAGTGYTLRAAGGTLTPAVSGPFGVVAGPPAAAQSSLVASPATITAATGTATVTVTARDVNGNPVSGATVTLAATGAGNSIGQPPATDASGVAVGSLTSTVAGDKIVSASINGMGIVQTDTVTVAPGAATQLAFTGQPRNTSAGNPIAPPVSVTVRDAQGNTVTGFTGSVLMAIGTNPSGGTLSGTTSVAAVGGVATFDDLSIGKAGSGYTLAASSGSLGPTPSAAFDITTGGVSSSRTTVSAAPGSIAASTGAVVSTITVTAKDGFGNPVSGATVVLFASGTGNVVTQPAGPTNDAGVATGTLSSIVTGSKTVSATVDAVPIAQTATVVVNPAAASASQSSVVAAPSTIGTCSSSCSTGAGTASLVTVTARDGFGNVIPSATVVVSVSGSNNRLSPSSTTATTNASGVATWTLSSTKAESKIISATVNAVAVTQTDTVIADPGAVSPAHSTVQAAPSAITVCGSACTTGTNTASLITVTAKDVSGNPIPNATVIVAVGGTVNTLTPASTTGTTDASGVATWTLSSTKAEAKVVSATIDGTGITQRDTVTVSAAPVSAAQSTVSSAPDTITACVSSCSTGAGTASLITITARDGFGNPVPTATVGLAVSGTGNTLNPPNPTGTTNTNGVVTWTLSSTTVESKVVSATINTVAIIQTDTVTVEVGPVSAGQSGVQATPTPITACSTSCSTGGNTASLITVTARDAAGNPVPSATVVLSVGGTVNTLTPTSTTATTDASGVATWTVSSTKAEAKVVSATIDGSAITQRDTVTVTAAAASASTSTVSAAPTSITACNASCSTGGNTASLLTVTVRDAFSNPVPGATVMVATGGTSNTLNPSSTTGTTNSSGVVTWTLNSTMAEQKVVSATANAAVITQTDTVTVNAGAVSGAVSTVSASPSSITASSGSSASTITVTAKDAFSNPIQGAAVVLAATGSGNTLTQPISPTGISGVTTGQLSSTGSGSKVVSATIQGTTITQTDTVTVTAAAADSLAFLVQPNSTPAGTVITPAVQVEIRDQFGNRVTTATNDVTLAIGTNPGGGTLSGGDPGVAAVAGVATFSSLSIDLNGDGYTLTAAATTLKGATSGAFNITSNPPSASQSTAIASPTSIVAGSSTSTITVTVRDAGGLPLSGITVTLSSTGSGNTITQPSGPTGANGIATGTLSSTTAESKTVTAVANGVTITQKPAVTVTAGPVSGSVSTVVASPTSIIETTGTSTITVTVKDSYNNPISGATVTLSASGSGNTLTQPSGPTGTNGVATGTLSSSAVGTKTVTAVASSVTLTQQPTVTVTSSGGSFVMIGAGDMTDCSRWQDDSVGALINRTPGEVFTLGDNAYPNGTASEFTNCYGPAWGAFKARTHPTVGNRDYNTKNPFPAAPYYNYFGSAAGVAGQGYYSYDVGAWHVIVLNGEIDTDAGSAQVTWLTSDLNAHPNLCTMAMVHEPLWSSWDSNSGNTGAYESGIRPLWNVLYAHNVDLVLSGHRHDYERIGPIKPDGTSDPVNGIRTLIVGTGGEGVSSGFTNIFPFSEVREPSTFGAMKLTLSSTGWSWQFLPITGETFTDAGSANCH